MPLRQRLLGHPARLHVLAPVLVGSLIVYSAAFAQSTGSQTTVQEVVVTAKHTKSIGGLAVPVTTAKDTSIITQDYIKHLPGSSNFAQVIDTLPGVTYSTEDPTGVLSSDFRLHGIPGDHVSFTLDGTPLNDTGNYAIYPGEYTPSEVIDHVTVNIGQTEVDSPSASALGGTVNIIGKTPPTTMGAYVSAEGGSFNFQRVFAELDTGAVGPLGTRGYFAFNEVDSNKYKGRGEIKGWGADGKLYQPLNGNDFVALAYTWQQNRPYFYESNSFAQYATYGRSIDWNTQWAIPSVTPGVADNVGPTTSPASNPSGTAPFAPGFEQGNDAQYWKLHPNPVDFGDLRGSSRFDLSHGLTLTVDPYLFYTLANGGGTTSLKESDPRLTGLNFNPGYKPFGSATAVGYNGGAINKGAACVNGGNGVDENGDGDCLDTVLMYSASNTQTHRYGVNSSLIWDVNPDNRFQLAYAFDYGRHRQTGEFTTINQQTGEPANVFGGKSGYGPAVLAADGTALRTRDRFSIAQLNQVALNYIGKFDDEKIHINLGLRDPMFTRHLNQFCYTYNGSSAWCDSVNPTAIGFVNPAGTTTALFLDNNNGVVSAGSPVGSTTPCVVAGAISANCLGGKTAPNLTALLGTTVKYGANGAPNIRAPFSQTFNYSKVLPNTGITYQLDDHNLFYITYDQSFSAPKTDDLYVSSNETVQPETTTQYGVGWRFQAPTLTTSVNLWDTTWNNHIIQSFDPLDPTLSIDRNVGTVLLYGVDIEAGWKVTPDFSLYASGTLMHSRLQGNYTVATNASVPVATQLPVKGKELVMSPDEEVSLRGQYTFGDFSIGLQGKYEGRRWLDDVNSVSLDGFIVANLDAEYNFSLGNTKEVLQLNVHNLFGANYYSRSNTAGNFTPVTTAQGTVSASSGPFVYVGAPPSVYVTLKANF